MEMCIRDRLACVRIKLNVLDGRFGLSGQVERVSVGVIDVAGLLEDLHGACELRGIIGADVYKRQGISGTLYAGR